MSDELSALGRESNEINILISDFLQESAETLKRILEMCGYHAFIATDGRDIVDKARRIKPDLIILDINLPGSNVDGLQACRLIKSDVASRGIPIIMVSALHGAEAQEAAFSAGAGHFFRKPYDVDALLECIDSSLSGVVSAPEWEN
jgi:two-component system cell cycle response regulator